MRYFIFLFCCGLAFTSGGSESELILEFQSPVQVVLTTLAGERIYIDVT